MITKFKLPVDACLMGLPLLNDHPHVLDMHGSFYDKGKSLVSMLVDLRVEFPELAMTDVISFCVTMRYLLKGEEVPVFITNEEDEELFYDIRDRFRLSQKEAEGMLVNELKTSNYYNKVFKYRLLLLCQENVSVFDENLSPDEKNDVMKRILDGITKEGFEHVIIGHVEIFVTSISNSLNAYRLPLFAKDETKHYGILAAMTTMRRNKRKSEVLAMPVTPVAPPDDVTPKKRRGRKRKIAEDTPKEAVGDASKDADQDVVKDVVEMLVKEAAKQVDKSEDADTEGPPVKIPKIPLTDDQKIAVLTALKSFPTLLLHRSCGWTGKIWPHFLPAVMKLDDTIPERKLRVFIQHLRARNIRAGMAPKLRKEGENLFIEVLKTVAKNYGKSSALIGRFIIRYLTKLPQFLEADITGNEKDPGLTRFAIEVSKYAEKEVSVVDIHNMVQDWKTKLEETGVYPDFTNNKRYSQAFEKVFVKGRKLRPIEDGGAVPVDGAVSGGEDPLFKGVVPIKREVIEDDGEELSEHSEQKRLHSMMNKYIKQEPVDEENNGNPVTKKREEGGSSLREIFASMRSPIREDHSRSPLHETLQSPRSVLTDPSDLFEDAGSGGELDVEEPTVASTQNHIQFLINKYMKREPVVEKPVPVERDEADSSLCEVLESLRSPIREDHSRSPLHETLQSPRSVLTDPNDVFEDADSDGELDVEEPPEASGQYLLNKYIKHEPVGEDDEDYGKSVPMKRKEAGSSLREVLEGMRSPVREVQARSPLHEALLSPRSVFSDPNDIFEDAGSGGDLHIVEEDLEEVDVASEASGKSLGSLFDHAIDNNGDGYTSTDDQLFNPFANIVCVDSPAAPEPEPHNASSDKSWHVEEL